jgi:CheY-like chemotaxis protein
MRLTALLVEDHEPTRRIVESVLASEGVRTESVTNGREALAYLAEKTPDLVVTDLIMPFVDGLTLSQTLRQRPWTAQLPILMVSGAGPSEELTSSCREVGAELLQKPFRRSELVSALRRLLPLPGRRNDVVVPDPAELPLGPSASGLALAST